MWGKQKWKVQVYLKNLHILCYDCVSICKFMYFTNEFCCRMSYFLPLVTWRIGWARLSASGAPRRWTILRATAPIALSAITQSKAISLRYGELILIIIFCLFLSHFYVNRKKQYKAIVIIIGKMNYSEIP